MHDIFNRFAICFDVHLTFCSLAMDKLEASFPERSLEYCEKVQRELGLLSACLRQNEQMCTLAERRGAPTS